MTEFNQAVSKLKEFGIINLTKEEENIILFHLSLNQNIYSIIYFIRHLRNRALVIARLKEYAIFEADLSEQELKWIEELLNGNLSIDEIVDKIRDYRNKPKQSASDSFEPKW